MTNKETKFGGEEQFLHDVATPLSIAAMLVNSLLDDMQNRSEINIEETVQLGEIAESLEKIKKLFHQGFDPFLVPMFGYNHVKACKNNNYSTAHNGDIGCCVEQHISKKDTPYHLRIMKR